MNPLIPAEESADYVAYCRWRNAGSPHGADGAPVPVPAPVQTDYVYDPVSHLLTGPYHGEPDASKRLTIADLPSRAGVMIADALNILSPQGPQPVGGWVQSRIGAEQLGRLRDTLHRPDRDTLTAWEVVEIAADQAERYTIPWMIDVVTDATPHDDDCRYPDTPCGCRALELRAAVLEGLGAAPRHGIGQGRVTAPPQEPERRAPVQSSGVWTSPRTGTTVPAAGPGTVSWAEHVEAAADYARRFSNGQSAEDLARRGGFSYVELFDHLGREPRTWQPLDRAR